MPFIELVAQRTRPTPPAGMQPPENAKDWFRMEATPNEDDSTDVLIYSSIGGWFGMWADEFVDELKAVTTSKINLRLNSPGGSVFDGIAIANAIRSHPATVTVYVDSLAASIASVIAMSGDRLVMMPQSQIMVHNASGACYGDATEMTKMADLLDKQSMNIARAYAEHTGRPLDEWVSYMADETWFSAEEALAVGLADEVMPMRPKKGEDAEEPAAVAAQMHRTWDLSMYRFAGREQAPAPKTPFAKGGLVPAGAVITAGLVNGIQLPATPAVEPVMQVGSPEFREYLLNTIRKELAAQAAAAIADASPTPPDEGEEEEEEESPEEEETQPDDSLAAPPDTSDGEPQVNADITAAPEETPPDTGAPVTEPHDEADDWTKVVGFLVSPATSPSADDVFAQLKEGW